MKLVQHIRFFLQKNVIIFFFAHCFLELNEGEGDYTSASFQCNNNLRLQKNFSNISSPRPLLYRLAVVVSLEEKKSTKTVLRDQNIINIRDKTSGFFFWSCVLEQ